MNKSATDLKVGGLTRLSTCDWPGQLVATVFCQGCAWDCPYCHNPGLRAAQADELVPWSSILEFLRGRAKLLDAVVFSGGEPLLQSALSEAIAEVRLLGFRVGLHTTGMLPDRFAALLSQLDWVGFDVKAPPGAYARITGAEHSWGKVRSSLIALVGSGIPYEVRTTVHPALLNQEEMLELKRELVEHRVQHFVVQSYRSSGTRPGRLRCSEAPPVLPPNMKDAFLSFHLR